MAVRDIIVIKKVVGVVEGHILCCTGRSNHLRRTMNGIKKMTRWFVSEEYSECETMSHQLLPKLTSSFTSFPHTAEEPRTEKQSTARMADDRIFILKLVATMFDFWNL
jgi:hypothetical protein